MRHEIRNNSTTKGKEKRKLHVAIQGIVPIRNEDPSFGYVGKGKETRLERKRDFSLSGRGSTSSSALLGSRGKGAPCDST